jgi:hypothetical protein
MGAVRDMWHESFAAILSPRSQSPQADAGVANEVAAADSSDLQLQWRCLYTPVMCYTDEAPKGVAYGTGGRVTSPEAATS